MAGVLGADSPAFWRDSSHAHRLAQERRAGEREPPRQLLRLADADARARGDAAQVVFGPRHDAKRLPVEAEAVERVGHAERLAEPAGARAKETQVVEAAALAHPRDAVGRLEGADQHPGAMA